MISSLRRYETERQLFDKDSNARKITRSNELLRLRELKPTFIDDQLFLIQKTLFVRSSLDLVARIRRIS